MSCYRVYVQGPVATKFKKGACENCGAMTHKRKDCLEVSMAVLSLVAVLMSCWLEMARYRIFLDFYL